MIPTEEEKQKIQEAQLANPDVPLGSAEQFLLTLSSISELSARLQLWAFKMDYEATEKVGANSQKLKQIKGRKGGRLWFTQKQTKGTCVGQVRLTSVLLSRLFVLVPTTSAEHRHTYVITSPRLAAARLARAENASERKSSKPPFL